jgi:hypothetical protein
MRLHISMQVDQFDKAVGFYSMLFGEDPSVVRDSYAKWDLKNPNVNFVIEALGNEVRVDHLGIQAESEEELQTIAARMRDSGQPFLDVENAQCCYANLDKAWVKGMAGEKWEAFFTHGQSEQEYGEDREHLLDVM